MSHENIEKKIIALSRTDANGMKDKMGIQIPITKMIGHIASGSGPEIGRL